MRPHRPSASFPMHLDALYRAFPVERSLAMDPLSCVRPFANDRRAAEVAGIMAATLAVGNTRAILRSFGTLAEQIAGDFSGFVDAARPRRPPGPLVDFRHRWLRGDQLEYLGYQLQQLYRSYDSLEEVFLEGMAGSDGFAGGIAALSQGLRGPEAASAPERYRYLFPSPLGPSHSPCKRLALFVRWMVRTEYPDLGLWTRVPTAELRIPLDHHVFWIAYNLGLTARRTPSWAAVEEITAALKRIDPNDPIKYDFVLCHTGISGDCPKHRDLAICGRCAVRPDCRLWRGRVAA
ncbi:MAG: DUF2400 domain-containing protein [Thermoplasmata archaeon]|nr:DUF2400 domain-containing protein [Thermoplasmata archaeon]